MPNRSQLNANMPTIALISVLLIGILVRIRQYMFGISLWVDEAALALNIIDRSFFDLTRPLEYSQGAPTGFLWLTKLAIMAGNDSEFWLRLVPLLAGLSTLVLFPLVARHYLSRNATVLALLLLAMSERLINYSTEVKQYSLDVLMTVCGLALFLMLKNKPLNLGRAIAVFVVGSLMLWISHPAVFILGMVGSYALISAWRDGNRHQLILTLLIGLAWLASIIIQLSLTLGNLSQNEYLLSFWAGGFGPSISTGTNWLSWHWRKLNNLPGFGLGLSASVLSVLAIISGVIVYYRKDKALLFSLVAPIGLVLVASWMKRYPVEDRMILFTAPITAILVAQGVEELFRTLRSRSRILAFALPIILLIDPALGTLNLLQHPDYKEELRPVIGKIQENWQDGDHIYVYYSSYLAFEYYRPRFGFSEADFTIGTRSREDWSVYLKELDKLTASGQRTWLVFSHVHNESGADEEVLFINYLKEKGFTYTDKFTAVGASTYLFDFRQSAGSD